MYGLHWGSFWACMSCWIRSPLLLGLRSILSRSGLRHWVRRWREWRKYWVNASMRVWVRISSTRAISRWWRCWKDTSTWWQKPEPTVIWGPPSLLIQLSLDLMWDCTGRNIQTYTSEYSTTNPSTSPISAPTHSSKPLDLTPTTPSWSKLWRWLPPATTPISSVSTV